jgi:hypothetical protein
MALDLIGARKKAEAAVADMADGALKTKAFEVILQSLLVLPATPQVRSESSGVAEKPGKRETGSSIAARIQSLEDEDFFSEPRSLSEIQEALRTHGWHYPQGNLSTPLVRMVRDRKLRRLQLSEGNKKVWKYSFP